MISAEKHPNADRLRVCMVDIGDGEPIQVVCGAPNARAGMKGVFSPPGTFIPGKNITLTVGTIRGVESRGMLCSAAELMISDDHDGIIELPADAPVGKPYVEWAGLNEPVDRHQSHAQPPRLHRRQRHRARSRRHLASALQGPPAEAGEGTFPCPVKVTLDFGATPRSARAFGLRLVRGVKNGPSPEWLQKRLTAIGLRPINALVDITNFITFDRGRPLHVFDAAKVHGNLTVRRAHNGETLLALDGKTYTLDQAMCVIADEKGVELLAGIMGGEATGCARDHHRRADRIGAVGRSSTSRRPAASSASIPTRAIASSAASIRISCCRASSSPRRWCSISAAAKPSEIVRRRRSDAEGNDHRFSLERIAAARRHQAAAAEVRRVLEKLGFFAAGQSERVKVAVPSWRPDVHGRADIVEELVRIVGVDQRAVDAVPARRHARKPVLTPIQNRTRKAKRALAARGLIEAVTWSFVSKREAELFGGGKPELALANPIAAELSDMRPSLIPGLVDGGAAQRRPRLSPTWRCSRSGRSSRATSRRISSPPPTGLRRALAKAAGIGRHWSSKAEPVDAFDAKADAFAVLAAAGAPMQALQVVPGGPAWFHPGRSGTIQIGPQNVLGAFGELHPRALAALKADGPLVGVRSDPGKNPRAEGQGHARQAHARAVAVPAGRRAISPSWWTRSVKAADIVRAAQSVDKKLIVGVTVFDVYEGKGIDPGKKSIAIAVTMQPREKTMTDAEIDALGQKIVAEVARKTGGVLRVEELVVTRESGHPVLRRPSMAHGVLGPGLSLRSPGTTPVFTPATNPQRQSRRARRSRRP